jgi:hypothetical protein
MPIMAAAGTIAWFLLTVSLWYAKPSEPAWLAGSMLLGAAYFIGFFFYVTRPK